MARLRPVLILPLMLALAAPAAATLQVSPEEAGRLQARRQDELSRARRLRQDARAVAEEIARLSQEQARLALDQTGDQATLLEQRARLDALRARETEILTRLGAERGRLSRLLGALQLFRRDPPPALLVSPDSATDAVRAAILMQAVTPALKRRADALAAEQSRVLTLRRQAVIESQALITTESALSERGADIEALIAQRRALEAGLSQDADAADAEADALGRRLRALGLEVGDLPPDSGPALRGAAGLPGGRTRLTPPLPGGFTPQDRGLSWRAEALAGVAAPAEGRVDYAGPLEGWGQVVVLHLGGTWRVVVAGLGETTVATGERVREGQVLGRAPDAAGSDIYVEVRREERPVDPARWFRR
ncbi:peptidoglycan DD-metalloendopeptidase family protein [Brevundimonas sp. 2R-24]|uniref:Peptidoglycan DD-metalloendopeptidase family protein n=1 Tax=Peiella sedimenti TaxID=3061083 RepID=A0ABT8SNY1_9CAUL|nr:peptidoglycan DD-metalloendopeptidase family protein [Caulobacteraceae bacterium XZ-24]